MADTLPVVRRRLRTTFLITLLIYIGLVDNAAQAEDAFAVIAHSPADGAVRVPLEVRPTATLNKDIFGISAYGFSLRRTDTGYGVYTSVQYNAATRTITLIPADPLDEYTRYTAQVAGVTAITGETIDPPVIWTFRTQDRTPPVVIASRDSGRYIVVLNVALACDDGAGSGCAAIHYTLDGSEPTAGSPVYTGPITLDEGEYTLKFFARDNEDNASAVQTRQYIVDLTPPEVVPPTTPRGDATEVNLTTPVVLRFSEAVRPETVTEQTITVDQGVLGAVSYDTATDTATFTPAERLACNTTHTVTVGPAVLDLAGNAMAAAYTWSFTTNQDCDAPRVSVSSPGGVYRQASLAVSLSCSDATSGCKRLVYTTDGTAPSFAPVNGTVAEGETAGPVAMGEGNTTLRYLAEDFAGHLAAEHEQIYSLSTQGFLYVGTDNGIGRGAGPAPDDFVFMWQHAGTSSLFYDDSIGRLYLGFSNSVLYSDDLGERWTFRGLDHWWSSARYAPVSAIAAHGGKVYAATQAGLQVSHDGLASVERRGYAEGIDGDYMRDVTADGRYVYAATRSGVAISDTKGQTFVTRGLDAGLADDDVGSVAVDGNRIFATTRAGLAVSLDGGETFVNRTTADGLAVDSYLSDVFVDGNNVYVATGAGLSISSDGGQGFITRTPADGLGHWNVTAVHAHNGTVYAGTSEGLSISTDGGQSFITRTRLDGLPKNNVTDVLAAAGKLFVATTLGAAVSEDGGVSFRPLGLPGSWARRVIPRGDTLYVATDHGLVMSHDGGASFTTRSLRDGLGDPYITDLFIAPDNAIYLATLGGLAFSTDGGQSFFNYTTAWRLPSNDVYGVFVDGQGTLFGSTNWGLGVKAAKGGKWFRTRTTDDGLADNWGYKVNGGNGVLYVASSRGLSVSYDGGDTFVVRTRADGLGSDGVGDIYVDGDTAYLSSGGLAVTHDGGRTFSVINTDVRTGSISAYGEYLYTTGYDLYISNDGGLSFITRDHTHGIGHSLTSIWSANYTP